MEWRCYSPGAAKASKIKDNFDAITISGGLEHENGRKNGIWPTRDSVKDYFPLPKEIFSLGLSTAEIAIYAYLLSCEDRQTFQCWPSYRKNGEAVGLSPNTIRPIQTALPCFCA